MSSEIRTVRIGPSPCIAVDYAGSGEAVLFMHGVGGNKSNWKQQLIEFSSAYQTLAWDMRGYGESDDYEGPMVINDVCDDVIKVLDHFEIQVIHMVGLSLGAMVAQEFYRRYPNRVQTMVLANTNAGPAADWTPVEREEFVRLRTAPLMSGQTPDQFAPAIVNTLVGSQTSDAVKAELAESISGLRAASFMKAVEAVVQFDSSEILSRIAVPTLLIGSREDRVTPLKNMRDMAEIIPDAKLVELDGGHLSNMEQPEAFNRVVHEFLASHSLQQAQT